MCWRKITQNNDTVIVLHGDMHDLAGRFLHTGKSAGAKETAALNVDTDLEAAIITTCETFDTCRYYSLVNPGFQINAFISLTKLTAEWTGISSFCFPH